MEEFFRKAKIICMIFALAAMLCTFTACESFVVYNDSGYDEYYLDKYNDGAYESDTAETVDTESETVISEIQQPDYPEPESVTESEAEKLSVEKDGSYTTPEDVAEYIHTFGTLPSNFITKSEARELGWDSKKGNLWDVADGMSIGGDRFGNYEGLLPEADGRKYTECDVNYEGGYRGSERIIFSNDGLIFYTNDHYESFTQLY